MPKPLKITLIILSFLILAWIVKEGYMIGKALWEDATPY